MTLHEKQAIFSKNVAALIDYIYANEHTISFGEAFRTPQQAEIYAKEGKGIADSLHIKRLAIDLNLFNIKGQLLSEKSDFEPFGNYWKSLHPLNRWGGDFSHLVDSNHFEMQDA